MGLISEAHSTSSGHCSSPAPSARSLCYTSIYLRPPTRINGSGSGKINWTIFAIVNPKLVTESAFAQRVAARTSIHGMAQCTVFVPPPNRGRKLGQIIGRCVTPFTGTWEAYASKELAGECMVNATRFPIFKSPLEQQKVSLTSLHNCVLLLRFWLFTCMVRGCVRDP